MRCLPVCAWLAASLASASAFGQSSERKVVEEPTSGIYLPTAGISGEVDALTTTQNPAGLLFEPGGTLDLALDLGDADKLTSSGPGFGLYYSQSLFGGVLPRIGQGMALEFLRPPRVRLAPDPGTPARFTLANAIPLGPRGSAALGFSWHHFFDDGALGGLDTFDLGWSARFGAYLAAGLVVRDLGAPTVADTPVERRYELELTTRPLATDRLELSLGGRIGETRADLSTGADLDGWGRVSWRVLRGAYLRGELESRSLFEIASGVAGDESFERREWRASLGLELSFGGLGLSSYGTGTMGGGDTRLVGGTLVARLSTVEVPSILPERERIERLDLAGSMSETELAERIVHLRQLRRDGALRAVVVQLDNFEAGWATTEELRDELVALRRRGVKVFAYVVAGTTRQYFLASAADRIYVDPAGGLRLFGFASDTLYFKGLFDKLGILAQFEKIEEYKSAPEAYTRTGPTEPAFTMRNELYDSLYETMVAAIAEGRHLEPAKVRVLIDNGPYTAGELAKLPALVDAVADPDQVSALIARELGGALAVGERPTERDSRWSYPTIAVINIEGDIVDGKSQVVPILGMKLVGGDTVAGAIAAARASSRVKAIVLRINSPGGSALASELISREVFKTRGVKPIICSMGDVAASGGYFSAAGCDQILADPMTITGSIGIFNGKFDFSGLLGKLGITWSTFKRGTYADVDSFLRPYSDEERVLMKRKLHYYYGRFLHAVARGRGLSEEKVNQVGRGHVWTGTQARPIALIDRFGGLGDAIALAKQRVGLGDDDEARLLILPKPTAGLLERLLSPFGRSDDQAGEAGALLRALIPGVADRALLQALPGSVWFEPGVPQARLPFGFRLPD